MVMPMPELESLLLGVLVKAAANRDLVTIDDVKLRLDRCHLNRSIMDDLSRNIDTGLRVISNWCSRNQMPPLNALYVKRPHFVAGIGFFQTQNYVTTDANIRLQYWRESVERVYKFFDLKGEDHDSDT